MTGRHVTAGRSRQRHGSVPLRAATAHAVAAVAATACAAAAALALVPAGAAAAPGDLDPVFGNGGKRLLAGDDTPVELLAQPDGKLVIVSFDTGFDFVVRRLNPDGSPDRSFGGDGTAGADFGGEERARGGALQPDGKILVVGTTLQPGPSLIARFDTDGTLDESFSPGGADGSGKATVAGLTADEIIVAPDASIVLAGTDFGSLMAARLLPNGSPDNVAFEPTDFDGDREAGQAGAVAPDGTVLVAGPTFRPQEVESNATVIARYLPSGRLDRAFNGNGALRLATIEDVKSVLVQPDRKVLVAGTSSDVDPALAVTRLNTDGTPDLAFGNGGTAVVGLEGKDQLTSALLAPDGKIHLTGTSVGDYTLGTARLNPDGTLDAGFGAGGVASFSVDGFTFGGPSALQPDGKLAIAGLTVLPGPIARSYAIRVLTAAPPPLPPTPVPVPPDGPKPSPAPGPGPGGRAPRPGDTTAPRISALRVVQMRRGRIEVRFSLSEPGRVRFTLQRAVRRGFRPHPGAFAVAGSRGANRVRVDDRRAFQRLQAGRYRWVLGATDAAGNAAPAARTGFEVAVATSKRRAARR
jgi:uncharacterized delta-60 repeat protein